MSKEVLTERVQADNLHAGYLVVSRFFNCAIMSEITQFLKSRLAPNTAWLSDLNKRDHEAIKRLQETDLKTDVNFIAPVQD